MLGSVLLSWAWLIVIKFLLLSLTPSNKNLRGSTMKITRAQAMGDKRKKKKKR